MLELRAQQGQDLGPDFIQLGGGDPPFVLRLAGDPIEALDLVGQDSARTVTGNQELRHHPRRYNLADTPPSSRFGTSQDGCHGAIGAGPSTSDGPGRLRNIPGPAKV